MRNSEVVELHNVRLAAPVQKLFSALIHMFQSRTRRWQVRRLNETIKP